MTTLTPFILVCEMEDFLTFWESFYSNANVWNLEEFNKESLDGKISKDKLAVLDCSMIRSRMANIKAGVADIDINEEVMDLLHKEYMSNHNNIVDVLNNISDMIDKGQSF